MSNLEHVTGLIVDASKAYARSAREAPLTIDKLNILVAGNSGIGKSTLINGVFGQRLAETGVGRSQTQDIQSYTVEGHPVCIYDTRGFEIKGAEQTVSAVRDKITTLRGQPDANDQIHIAWNCILEQSHRVEPIHLKFLDMLNSQQIPTIVVITQALGDVEMENKVRELAIPNQAVIPVLAQEKRISGQTISPHGISDLVDATLRLLPVAQRSAFQAAQQARWDIKEAAALREINLAVKEAAASAFIPISGGHSVALLGIQANLIMRINSSLGLSGWVGGREMITALFGMVVSRLGGQTAFSFAITEVMRLFPGIGWVGAAAIGGPIAAAFTKAFGHVYLDAVKVYAQADMPLPSPEDLADRMRHLLERNGSFYRQISAD
jgi:predicted GTPase